jgi:HK97 family phage major capsid protein
LHRTESNLSFKKIKMLAQDLTAYTTLSRDLIQDSTVSIDSYAVRMIGGAIGWREDWESINGNGAGQMLGYLNSPAVLLIARNTSSHIKYQDVFTMKTRFMAGAQSPCWIVHPYALYDIETLVDPSGRFIYISGGTLLQGASPTMPAPGSIQYKPAGYLLGWPIYTSEKVPQLGTQGDLSLIDRKCYWFGRRAGLEVGLSEHFLFDQDELAIRAKVRNDGKPGLLAPVYLADGSGTNQVSSFVVLQ